jgi:hypothetical protein
MTNYWDSTVIISLNVKLECRVLGC